jgi:chromate transport protein ChrA
MCRLSHNKENFEHGHRLCRFLNVAMLGEFIPGPLAKHIASSFGCDLKISGTVTGFANF